MHTCKPRSQHGHVYTSAYRLVMQRWGTHGKNDVHDMIEHDQIPQSICTLLYGMVTSGLCLRSLFFVCAKSVQRSSCIIAVMMSSGCTWCASCMWTWSMLEKRLNLVEKWQLVYIGMYICIWHGDSTCKDISSLADVVRCLSWVCCSSHVHISVCLSRSLWLVANMHSHTHMLCTKPST